MLVTSYAVTNQLNEYHDINNNHDISDDYNYIIAQIFNIAHPYHLYSWNILYTAGKFSRKKITNFLKHLVKSLANEYH